MTPVRVVACSISAGVAGATASEVGFQRSSGKMINAGSVSVSVAADGSATTAGCGGVPAGPQKNQPTAAVAAMTTRVTSQRAGRPADVPVAVCVMIASSTESTGDQSWIGGGGGSLVGSLTESLATLEGP